MTYFYHAVVDSPHLPRDLASDSAQSAITTLLGEMWPCEKRVPIPSSGLVSLLGTVGISEPAARTALARMVRRGTLELVRDGRRTSYRLTSQVALSIPRSEILTMGFGVHPRQWDGQWTMVLFSFPETQRDARRSLREWLTWLGFGPLRDGAWISPHANVEIVREAIAHLLPPDALVLRTAQVFGTVEADSVWPLAELATVYTEFESTFRPYIYRLRAEDISASATLQVWLQLLGRWRGFPTVDPDLPAAALPADWPRRAARRVFETLHDAAVPRVGALVRAHFAEYPEVADLVRPLTVDEHLDVYGRMGPIPEIGSLNDIAPSLLPTTGRLAAS